MWFLITAVCAWFIGKLLIDRYLDMGMNLSLAKRTALDDKKCFEIRPPISIFSTVLFFLKFSIDQCNLTRRTALIRFLQLCFELLESITAVRAFLLVKNKFSGKKKLSVTRVEKEILHNSV